MNQRENLILDGIQIGHLKFLEVDEASNKLPTIFFVDLTQVAYNWHELGYGIVTVYGNKT